MKWRDDDDISWTDLWPGVVIGLGVVGIIFYALAKMLGW